MPSSADGITILPGNTADLLAMGVNATLARGDERESFHFPGRSAMADLVAHCDRFDYRVVTISTPRTIYRDLQGSRETLANFTHSTGRKGQRMAQVNTPEAKALGRIGRKDLLA